MILLDNIILTKHTWNCISQWSCCDVPKHRLTYSVHCCWMEFKALHILFFNIRSVIHPNSVACLKGDLICHAHHFAVENCSRLSITYHHMYRHNTKKMLYLQIVYLITCPPQANIIFGSMCKCVLLTDFLFFVVVYT